MRSSIPRLTWDHESRDHAFVMTWDRSSSTGVLGYHLYRSSNRDVGYGQFGPGLINATCIGLNLRHLVPGYYAIAAVGVAGPGRLSSPLRIPEGLAFHPRFKDAALIDPDHAPDLACTRPCTRIYRSLEEALRSESSSGVFVTPRRRDEIAGLLVSNRSSDVRMYFGEDLDFLRGTVEAFLPGGLDSRGEIDLEFLSKTLPGSDPDLQLSLVAPKMKFSRRAGPADALRGQRGTDEEKKRSLTPESITATRGDKSVSLVWPHMSAPPYEGIRVFRALWVDGTPSHPLGEEIYEGPVSEGTVRCALDGSVDTKAQREPVIGSVALAPNEPPQRTTGTGNRITMTPSSPTSPGVRSGSPGLRTFYFSDQCRVPRKGTFKYTLYTFDGQGNYSFPIEINASMAGSASGLACAPVETQG